MLLDTAELTVTENKTCLPYLPGGALDSEPLANTTPLYGKEVGNGCALQVFKNTFSVREQMLRNTIQVTTWHHNQSYYCTWKQLSSSQIHKLLSFGSRHIYCTCKCLNTLHFHISMYIFLKHMDTTDHEQWWTNYCPGHNKLWEFTWHRELPKINFNFQSLRPLIYVELDVIKCCYLHFRCFCYLTLPDKICLLLYAEYVKHLLLQNILFQFVLRNQLAQTVPKCISS